METKIVLMGTPEFAANIFEKVIEAGYNIVAVISQPDKPVGRKKILQPTPVKELALKHNIPVYQPIKIRADYEFVKQINPDLIITCAYGQIVPQGLLDIPKYGCINIHGSLLPKLRGGAPIHRAIMNDDKEAGVTLMEMIDKMDAGKMYAKLSLPILDSDNLDSLSKKLSDLGAELILENLPKYLNGELKGIEQDESLVTYGFNIKREEEQIDWNKSTREVFNHIRALSMKPGAYTLFEGKSMKIYESKISSDKYNGEPGQIVDVNKKLVIKTSDGALEVLKLQLEGKNMVDALSFVNGHNNLLNQILK